MSAKPPQAVVTTAQQQPINLESQIPVPPLSWQGRLIRSATTKLASLKAEFKQILAQIEEAESQTGSPTPYNLMSKYNLF